MIKLSDSQRAIIVEGNATLHDHIHQLKAFRKFAPPLQSNIIKSMLKQELLEPFEEGGSHFYRLTDKAYAALKDEAPSTKPIPKTPARQIYVTIDKRLTNKPVKTEVVAEEDSSPEPEPVKPYRGATKQQTLLCFLSREEGATLKELQEATGWQSHSVRGAMSTMRKKLEGKVEFSSLGRGAERRYYAAPLAFDEEAVGNQHAIGN